MVVAAWIGEDWGLDQQAPDDARHRSSQEH